MNSTYNVPSVNMQCILTCMIQRVFFFKSCIIVFKTPLICTISEKLANWAKGIGNTVRRAFMWMKS